MKKATMIRTERTWVVVADGMRARFFSWKEGATTLAPAIGFDLSSPDARGHARDLNRRTPGRVFSSGRGQLRHAFEPRHDYHKLAKHAFNLAVGHVLGAAEAQRQFDRLVVIAPRRSLGELRSILPEQVRRRLWREIPNDLTRASPAELWARLRPHLGPVLFRP